MPRAGFGRSSCRTRSLVFGSSLTSLANIWRDGLQAFVIISLTNRILGWRAFDRWLQRKKTVKLSSCVNLVFTLNANSVRQLWMTIKKNTQMLITNSWSCWQLCRQPIPPRKNWFGSSFGKQDKVLKTNVGKDCPSHRRNYAAPRTRKVFRIKQQHMPDWPMEGEEMKSLT